MSDDGSTPTHGRRALLTTAGAGLATGLAGCLANAGGRSTPTATPTPELTGELAALRRATEQYADPKAALQEGFKVSGPPVPGMGWHLVNPKRVKAAAKQGLDPETPQVLTYVDGDDGLRLAAAEFAVPKGAVDGAPDLFTDGPVDAEEHWHVHESATHVFALPDDGVTSPKGVALADWTTGDHWAEFRPPNPDLSAGDTVALNWGSTSGKEGDRTERVVDVATTHPSLHTLHVWVHADNPEGVFHPTNPRFGGEDGHDH